MIYLDSLGLAETQVGYGDLGMHGSLGYEDKSVSVCGRSYPHALSTHAPARLRFQLDGRYASFSCQVALNEDVPARSSFAHFFVRADGIEVACAPYIVAGGQPRTITADIAGARALELIVETTAWDNCHAVWLDPQVSDKPCDNRRGRLDDPLGRARIELPPPRTPVECCVATVVSNGFETWLDDLLASLKIYGDCDDAARLVFGVDAGAGCRRVAEKHNALFVNCQRLANLNSTVKSILYSSAQVLPARKYICLDADMLVLGSLRPIFASIDVAPRASVFACREANGSRFTRLDTAIHTIYGGRPQDLGRLLGNNNGEGAYSLVVNDGTFAGSRNALLGLEGLIRSWTGAATWVDERRDVWWRNQFVFNLALAHSNCGIELDPVFNVQLNSQDVRLEHDNGYARALWQDRPVRVLHFNGRGRNRYADWRPIISGRSR
jgi:hypothetical protein